MNQTGRERATRHCRECRYHYQGSTPVSPHTCSKVGGYKIGHIRVRTSPDWCPLGHLMPGRSYPTFSPGEDPRFSKSDVERFRETYRIRPATIGPH